jgi:hypothetical protein
MNDQITLDDLEKVLEYINKCMYAFKFWEARYKQYLKTKMESNVQLKQHEIDNLQKNYDKVMNALIVCFDFIKSCDHILKDCKDTMLFGVIYVSTKEVETDNFELIKRIENYRKWYFERD